MKRNSDSDEVLGPKKKPRKGLSMKTDYSKPESLNPKSSKGIGMQIMRRMGYTGGGLGKHLQGIINPLEVTLRPKNQGLGFGTHKEFVDEKPLPPSGQSLEVETRPKEKFWSKKAAKKKQVCKTIEELLAEKQEQGFPKVIQKVLDMRGPQVRVLSNLENLYAEEDKDDPMLELRHKVRLLVDLAKFEVQKLQENLRNEREIVVALRNEKEKLQKKATQQKKHLENMQGIVNVLDSWDPRDPEPMIRLLESWEELLPPVVLQMILDKISAAVDLWDPRREHIPIHRWIHPWLPLLGHKLEKLYHTICDRLSNVFHEWHPSDMSAYHMLAPWKTVFHPVRWEMLIVRHIIPKLSIVMHELVINPANQNLDQFSWVMPWVLVIPTHCMMELMDIFFNKWEQVLYHWLCSKPKFEEVAKWYLGWKELLPPELHSNQHVRYRLTIGLITMNMAVQNKEMVAPPGLKENIRLREQKRETVAAQARWGIGGGHETMSLKDVIEIHAMRNGLDFKLKPGRKHDGHQIYGFGNVSIIVDSLNQKVFALTEDRWLLVSLEQLLDLHNQRH